MTKAATYMTRLTFSAVVLLAVSAPFFAPVFADPAGLIVLNTGVSSVQAK